MKKRQINESKKNEEEIKIEIAKRINDIKNIKREISISKQMKKNQN